MGKKKQKSGASWAKQYAKESAALKTLSDLDAMNRAYDYDIARSIERSKQIEDDIEAIRQQRKAYEEDPEGYSRNESYNQTIPELGDFGQDVTAAAQQYAKDNIPK